MILEHVRTCRELRALSDHDSAARMISTLRLRARVVVAHDSTKCCRAPWRDLTMTRRTAASSAHFLMRIIPFCLSLVAPFPFPSPECWRLSTATATIAFSRSSNRLALAFSQTPPSAAHIFSIAHGTNVQQFFQFFDVVRCRAMRLRRLRVTSCAPPCASR